MGFNPQLRGNSHCSSTGSTPSSSSVFPTTQQKLQEEETRGGGGVEQFQNLPAGPTSSPGELLSRKLRTLAGKIPPNTSFWTDLLLSPNLRCIWKSKVDDSSK